MKKLLIILMMFFASLSYSQTMIEMSNPNDADMIFLQVKDTSEADVIIYCADDKEEYESWDCMWKIKSWGFSNFSFYLAQTPNDSLLINEQGQKLLINGKIYFTHNKEIRGYKTSNAHIDGIMKVKRKE